MGCCCCLLVCLLGWLSLFICLLLWWFCYGFYKHSFVYCKFGCLVVLVCLGCFELCYLIVVLFGLGVSWCLVGDCYDVVLGVYVT